MNGNHVQTIKLKKLKKAVKSDCLFEFLYNMSVTFSAETLSRSFISSIQML